MRVSVCLPARNEQATVGAVVAAVVDGLVDGRGVVHEVVVVDDGSTDDTVAEATKAGARVVDAADLLAEVGPGTGKGEALWKAVYAAEGDILVFLDADLEDFDVRFVTALIDSLAADESLGLVKGFYRRDLEGSPGGGGRVTELMARPLIDVLFPHLAHIRQPLGGEFAARRSVLEQVPFVQGYGVDLALLVDVAARFGVEAVGEVDLVHRRHRNRPLTELRGHATEILRTALGRAGLLESLGSGPVPERPPLVEVTSAGPKGGPPPLR